MNTPPPDLEERDLVDPLRHGWGFEAASLTYAKLGFGSHHWTATDAAGAVRFVTVDDLTKVWLGGDPDGAFRRLRAAFEATLALADGGLEFVVAPVPDGDGRLLHRLCDRYSLAVFPCVDGDAPAYGAERSAAQQRAMTDLVTRLHATTPVVTGVAREEDFALPAMAELTTALADLDRPWTGGPYAEAARQLLAEVQADVVAALALHDRLVDEVRSDGTPWVVTHGEPHTGNVIWTADGPRLVDWDTVLIAPAGRDWWMLDDPSPSDPIDRVLYRLRWDLTELTLSVAEFHGPHEANADTEISWHGLVHCAKLREHWDARL